jgi:hypothetical protein
MPGTGKYGGENTGQAKEIPSTIFFQRQDLSCKQKAFLLQKNTIR